MLDYSVYLIRAPLRAIGARPGDRLVYAPGDSDWPYGLVRALTRQEVIAAANAPTSLLLTEGGLVPPAPPSPRRRRRAPLARPDLKLVR